ncbi:arginase family protein, partial [bacterium]|nr:arginase family protein [bacterium]
VTLGAIRSLKSRLGSEIGLIQFDAHADLRFAYEDNPLSHASVMRRISELGIPIAQFGTRSYCEEEQAFRSDKQNKITFHDAEELFLRFKENRKTKLLPANFPKKIYISFDIDGLDSSIMPATGTPVPGGLLWYQTLSLLTELTKGRTIIGMDLVEYSPIKGFHAYDFTAATLAYEMMSLI